MLTSVTATSYSRWLAAMIVASVMAFGSLAYAASETWTGAIWNSSGATRTCRCSVSCVNKSGCDWTAELGFSCVATPMTYGDISNCAYSVSAGAFCACRMGITPKKVRIEACMEDGVTPVACSVGR